MRKKLWLFVFMFLVFNIGYVYGTDVLVSSYTGGTTDSHPVLQPFPGAFGGLGMSFTPDGSGTISLSKVNLYLKKIDTPSDIYVQIRDAMATPKPTWQSDTKTATDLSTSYTWVAFNFSPAISLTAGTKYYIALLSGGSTAGVSWRYVQNGTDAFLGGGFWRYVDSSNQDLEASFYEVDFQAYKSEGGGGGGSATGVSIPILRYTTTGGGSASDDHNSTADPPDGGWTEVGARNVWNESGGNCSPGDQTAAGMLINDYACGNDGTLIVNKDETADWCGEYNGVVFRYQDTNTYYRIETHQADNLVKCYRGGATANSGTQVGSDVSYTIPSGFFDLKVIVSGSNFEVYIDNSLVTTFTDSNIASGKVGYWHASDQWNSYVNYNSFSWTDSGGSSSSKELLLDVCDNGGAYNVLTSGTAKQLSFCLAEAGGIETVTNSTKELKAGFYGPSFTATTLGVDITETSYDFGLLATDATAVASNALTVTNTGDGEENYQMKAIDTTNASNTTVWSLATSQGINQFVLQSAFHGSQPTNNGSTWGENDSVLEKNILKTLDKSCTSYFTINGTQMGTYVESQETRSLWLRVKTPTANSSPSTDASNISTLTITAEGVEE